MRNRYQVTLVMQVEIEGDSGDCRNMVSEGIIFMQQNDQLVIGRRTIKVEKTDGKTHIYDVYATDDNVDENYYVRARNATHAKECVRKVSSYAVVGATRLNIKKEIAEGLIDADMVPSIEANTKRVGVPWCYDSGT